MKNKSKENKNEEEKIKRNEVYFLQSWQSRVLAFPLQKIYDNSYPQA